MTRIERQMCLPDNFHELGLQYRVSHLMSMRSNVLMWHRRDVDHWKLGVIIGKIQWLWWSFAAITLTGIIEWAFGMWVEGAIGTGVFILGFILRDMFEGWQFHRI